jgi:hypothetical protein
MSKLWMAIEPELSETRLLLTHAPTGAALRARLPTVPADPRALGLLLEAITSWYGLPLCAALDADASDVHLHPERWAQLLGDLDERRVRVEWVASPGHDDRDRFLGALGDFRSARRLIVRAATGQR